MSTNLRIKMDFERPDPALVELFRGIPVANIADSMNRMSALDATIFPMNHAPMLGVALTVKSTGGDNLLFHKAIDLAKPGDIIVVAGGGNTNRSYAGEIMARYAASKGIAGFVVDGCMRDRDAIAKLDFPVYSVGVTPNGPYKNGPGEINFPVACAGQIIHPGDILVGDGDGVVVICPQEAAELAEKARQVMINEAQQLASISEGRGLPREWVDAKIHTLGFEIS